MYASEFLGYVVIIAGQEARVARAVIISTSINVLANLLLIPFYGLYAAATMTIATEAVLVLQYVWLLRQHLPVRQWSQALLRPLAATIMMGAVTIAVREHLPLLLTVALSALSYFVLLLSFGVIGRGELQFLRNLQHHLQQRVNARPIES
jgi:O-antigen/teichoic acid export membrane protein